MSVPLSSVARAVRAGRLEEAERACQAGLTAEPGNVALLQAAAFVAFSTGHWEEALRRARAALASAPDHGPTLILAGRAARRLGDPQAAAPLLRRAMALVPDRAEPAFLLGAALLEAADSQALDLLDLLTGRFPDDAAGWDEIGSVLARAGQPEAALAAFTRAFATRPSSGLAVRRAAALKELSRLPEARGALDEAAALGDMPARAWFLRGLVCQDLGDLIGSATAYRRSLDLDPSLAEAAVNLGIVLQETGDLDAAKSAYGRALAIRSDTFGRIAQAMTAPRTGELWLDLDALRTALLDR